MDGLDSEGVKIFSGKVTEIEGHDHLRMGDDGSGKHMAVVRVGEIQRANERFVTGHYAVRYGDVHQVPGAFELRPVDIVTFGQDISYPLVVNLLGPAGGKQVGGGESDQKISQRRRVQDAGIVNDDKPHT